MPIITPVAPSRSISVPSDGSLPTLVEMGRPSGTRASAVKTEMPSSRKPGAVHERELAADDFRKEAAPVLHELSKAVRRVLEGMPEPVKGPRKLERDLKIDYLLAWQVHKVANNTDPVAIGPAIPKPVSMARFFSAVEQVGVPQSVVQRARVAYDAFGVFVGKHAGESPKNGPGAGNRMSGRAAFDAMIGRMDSDASKTLSLSHRRSAYKANSFTWGVQAHVTFNSCILHPAKSPELTDAVLVAGLLGAHPLRADVALHLMLRPEARAYQARPVATTYSSNELTVLDDFSTKPLPKLETQYVDDDKVETFLRCDGVGRRASIDIVTAQLLAGAPNRHLETQHGSAKSIMIPSQVLIHDLLVPRGWTAPESAAVSTHGHTALFERVFRALPRHQLPIKESVEHLGNDIASLEVRDLPSCPAIVTKVLQDMGWNDTIFDIYRCRVQYPIMHTLVHMRVDAIRT